MPYGFSLCTGRSGLIHDPSRKRSTGADHGPRANGWNGSRSTAARCCHELDRNRTTHQGRKRDGTKHGGLAELPPRGADHPHPGGALRWLAGAGPSRWWQRVCWSCQHLQLKELGGLIQSAVVASEENSLFSVDVEFMGRAGWAAAGWGTSARAPTISSCPICSGVFAPVGQLWLP